MANNINDTSRPPRRGPMGRGPGGGMGAPGEKAKNFKEAVKRLFSELNKYRLLMAISLILAIFSAVIAILAPDRLSELTDEISSGLVVDKDSIQGLVSVTTENLSEEKLKEIMPEVLSLNINQETITKIMADNKISLEEKSKLQNLLANSKSDELLGRLYELSPEILSYIIPDSVYNNINISTQDKLEFINVINDIQQGNKNNIHIPDSIVSIIFPEIQIEGRKIDSKEQYEFLTLLGNLTKENDVQELYSKIDEMPTSIQDVIKPEMNMDNIKRISAILFTMYLLSALFSFVQALAMTDVANKFANQLRARISHKINKLPLSYFDQHATGDILSRVTNDVDTIAQSMNQSLASLITSTILFLGSIIMMFYTNWILALTAIISSLFGFMGMMLILGKSQKYFIERQVELGNLNGHIEEIYSGLNVVKAYNGKKDSDTKFDKLNKKVCDSNRKSQFLSGLMMPIMGFIGNFGYVAVCIVGALLTMNGNISFGVIVAFMIYVRLFTNPLSQIAQIGRAHV